jgi:hypothetical protein
LALEQELIKPDQEVKIRLLVRKKRQEIRVRRWKLTDAEWRTIFPLPWSDFQRALLQAHKDGKGEFPSRSIVVPGRYHGRSIRDERGPPSEGSYWQMNRLFAMSKLPFRFLWRYNKKRRARAISLATCTFPL